MAEGRRIGLIVNPLAGMGGRLATHGSDHFAGLLEAQAQGGIPIAEERAKRALRRLFSLCPEVEIITPPGRMGASAALASGFSPVPLDGPCPQISSAQDTKTAAQAIIGRNVELILFAGGDGTAHDIFEVAGDRLPLIGIPTGVKMHSAVFALTAEAAGESVALILGGNSATRLAEIMDADEAELAAGRPSARLFGYARTPHLPRLFQAAKAARPDGGEPAIEALGRKLAREAKPGQLVILGPGTTMALVKRAFGLNSPATVKHDSACSLFSPGRRNAEHSEVMRGQASEFASGLPAYDIRAIAWAPTPLCPAGHLPLKGGDWLRHRLATIKPPHTQHSIAVCGWERASGQSPPLRGRCPAGQRGVGDPGNQLETMSSGPSGNLLALGEMREQTSCKASLLGVDAVVDGKIIAQDADALTLEALCERHSDSSLLVGIVGGQGFVFGRGNQQISPKVLRAVTLDKIKIIATREKLLALPSPDLRIDTGDVELDRALEGYHRVETGPNDAMMMRLSAGI
jgi:predicted polyphosphate/ATP-dependent NAD kinase